MTRFGVDIYFLGLFAVVLDPDASGKKLALIVPRTDLGSALKRKKPAQDRGELRRHRWFLEFNPRQVDGAASVPRNALAQWMLSWRKSFHRLTFESDAGPLVIGNALDYVCDFAQVAPAYADLPARHLKWPAVSGNPDAAGQIMFDKGELIVPPNVLWQDWSFPGTLAGSGNIYAPRKCHFIHLNLKDISGFTVRARREQAESGQTLSLRGTPTQPVRITICNLCDINPLRWKTAGVPRVDDDYRWYYQLIEDPDSINENVLQGLDLPVPHPVGYANAQGQNCLETTYKPQSFVLD